MNNSEKTDDTEEEIMQNWEERQYKKIEEEDK